MDAVKLRADHGKVTDMHETTAGKTTAIIGETRALDETDTSVVGRRISSEFVGDGYLRQIGGSRIFFC